MRTILIAFSLFSSLYGAAQDTSITIIPKTTFTVLGGAVYAPRLHYYGRTDGLKSSALLPTLSIQFDSAHLYASGTSVLLNNKVQSMDYAGTIIEAGYRFGAQEGFAGNLYANKFFYNTSQLPQSALKEQAGFNINYQSKPIIINTAASVAFSDQADLFASAGLSKRFIFRKDKTVFLITPAALVHAGSQRYLEENIKNNGGIIPLPGQQTTSTTYNKFALLDYEFNTSFVAARKHVFLIVTPSYVMPQNLRQGETGSDGLYATISLLFSFKH